MSVSSISQSNIIGEDVLQMIFQQLEGEDLLNCEVVCRQWRAILLAGTPWRRLFHREVDCSLLWQKEQKKLEKNPTLRTDQYRDVCRSLLQVECNWRIGKFTKSIYRFGTKEWCPLTMSEDYMAWDMDDFAEFLDTESMKLTVMPVPKSGNYKVVDGALVTVKHNRDGNGQLVFEISDPNNRYVINVTGDEEGGGALAVVVLHMLYDASIRYKMFVVCVPIETDIYRIQIWKLGNPSTLFKTFTHKRLRRVKLGERFLLIQSEPRLILDSGLNLEFVSIENGESRNLILNYSGYTYAGGLVFQLLAKGIVRVWDPASGTYFRDLRLPLQNEDRFIKFLPRTSVNSKNIVVGWKYYNENMHSYLSVYDLQAIKNTNSDPNRHLLYTLEVPLRAQSFAMNESQIICLVRSHVANSKYNLMVISFAELAFKGKSSLPMQRTSEKTEIYSMCSSRMIL